MDKLKQIPARFLEIWKSWSRNQKIIIVSAVAVFIAAVVVIAVVLSRPTYQELTRCEDYNEMNTVTSLLTDNGYTYQIDNMAVKVKEQDLTNAKMLIASNDIKPSGYSLDDALNSSLTTTESDKNKKYAKYLETKFENDITSLDGIKSASVTVHLSDDTNSFYSTKKDTTVAVTIDTNKTVGEDTAESIAVLLATAVGSSNTNGITIIDTSGKTLFNGADNSGSVSNIAYSSKLKYKSQIESTVAASVKNTALSTSLFNDATVAINLDLDWDTVNKIATEYTAQEGREEGLYDTSYELESNGTNGAGGTPGTTSNGETGTTYDLTDGTSSSSTYTVKQYQYLPNQLVTTTNSDPGKIVYGTSTMAVTLIKNVIYNEEDCKNLGYLDNMTWDEFKAQNANPVQVNVDNDWMNMFSSATGISTNNETQSSGSVIAFTTESTDNKEKETQKATGKSDEETTQVNKETTTTVVARETESQRPTASIVIGDGSGLVQIEFKGVGTASEAADILYSAGIIEDKLAFYTYMDISGYAVRIRDGEYSLKPGDSYETIARTITQSD